MTLERCPERSEEASCDIFRRRVSQAEETLSAKALRKEPAWHGQGSAHGQYGRRGLKEGGLVEDELRLKMVRASQSFLDHNEDFGFYVE